MAEDEPLATANSNNVNLEHRSTQVVMGEGVSAFESTKFSNDELHTLGLDEKDPYYRVEFIEDKSISYFMCSCFVLSLITGTNYTFIYKNPMHASQNMSYFPFVCLCIYLLLI